MFIVGMIPHVNKFSKLEYFVKRLDKNSPCFTQFYVYTFSQRAVMIGPVRQKLLSRIPNEDTF